MSAQITHKLVLEGSATLQGLYDLLADIPAEVPLAAEVTDVGNYWVDHEHLDGGEIIEFEDPQEVLAITIEWTPEEES